MSNINITTKDTAKISVSVKPTTPVTISPKAQTQVSIKGVVGATHDLTGTDFGLLYKSGDNKISTSVVTYNANTQLVTFPGGISPASIFDTNGSRGTAGQILSSTGTALDWVDLTELSGVDGTGTANYVAKWSDSDSITDSSIYDNGTNVGIGTSSPNEKLVVHGNLWLQDVDPIIYGYNKNTSIDLYNNSAGIDLNTPSSNKPINLNGRIVVASTSQFLDRLIVSTAKNIESGSNALTLYTGNASMLFKIGHPTVGDFLWYDKDDNTMMKLTRGGNLGIGTTNGDFRNDGVAARTYVSIIGSGTRGVLNIGTTASNGADGGKITFVNGTNAVAEIYSDTSSGSQTSGIMVFSTSNTQRLNIDAGGNINKYISNYSATSVTIADNSVNGVGGTNNTGGLLVMKRDTGNLRSISAAGSINASGNDYAEYMTKSDGCGEIAKGDVVGVDVNGKLTKIFNDAISFVIKSTDPSYVGGDTWLTENQCNPEHEDYINPKSEEYNIARASVDRIAFCGQVPVNITGSFNVGDYVYPQANGTDIEAVAKSNPTFEEYQLCVGKIWAIQEDGRPFVSVKIN